MSKYGNSQQSDNSQQSPKNVKLWKFPVIWKKCRMLEIPRFMEKMSKYGKCQICQKMEIIPNSGSIVKKWKKCKNMEKMSNYGKMM